MSIVYLLKNQYEHFLGKSGEWLTPDNAKALFRTEFKDVALNQKAELSVKNFKLRVELAQATLSSSGELKLDSEVSEQPLDSTCA